MHARKQGSWGAGSAWHCFAMRCVASCCLLIRMSVFGPPFRSRARLAAVLEKFEDCGRPRHPRAVKGPVEEARKGEKARRRAVEGGFMLEGARVWMWKERCEGADMEGVRVWMRKA